MKKTLYPLLFFALLIVGCSNQPTATDIDKNTTIKKDKKKSIKYITIIKDGDNKDDTTKEIDSSKKITTKIKEIGKLQNNPNSKKIDGSTGVKTESENYMDRIKNIGKLQKSDGEIKKIEE